MSKTLFLLMAEFDGRAAVPITEVAPRYFGDQHPEVIRRKAKNREYPVLCRRMGESQKAPYMVKLEDLARHLDDDADERAIQDARAS